jgi:hypothetical protein
MMRTVRHTRSNVINFKNLSIITAVIAFVLFITMLLAPEVMFYLFQIPESESAIFMSRRAAILFLGIGLLSWLVRNATHSTSTQSIKMSFAIIMFGLVLLGSFEYIIGNAGIGIGLAIITELLLGVAYSKLWLSNRNA